MAELLPTILGEWQRRADVERWEISSDHSHLDKPGPLVWQDGYETIHADRSNPHRFTIDFEGLGAFALDFGERTIRAGAFADSSPATIRHLLLDQIFPRILAHDGQLVLHAAGVLSDRGVIIFVGRSGLGKSTLATSMHLMGWTLLGDDAMAVSSSAGASWGEALYRSLRLFPDSIGKLLNGSEQIAEVASYTSKLHVVNLHDQPPGGPLPLRAAFLLEPPRTDDIHLEPVGPTDACMAFVANSFCLDPTDVERNKRRMTEASKLAMGVPTFRIAYPRDYSRLSEVRDRIAETLD